VRRAAAGLLLLALASGCGGGGARPLDARGPHLPSLAERCGGATAGTHATVGFFRTSDGVRLDGAVLGNGKTGVVLAHESPADLCGWVPYARVLASDGFRVLLIDHRGFGRSDSAGDPSTCGRFSRDLEAAVAELKREGADKVFLMGASFGGITSMVSGSRLGSRVAGVVSVSGEEQLANSCGDTRVLSAELDALAAVPKLRAPFLILGSRDDGYLLPTQARQLERRAGSQHKRLVMFPGGEHGWDILDFGPYHARASRILVAFLRRYS
jgi:pimeloyl-ACP methyl ester carboxylesterase